MQIGYDVELTLASLVVRIPATGGAFALPKQGGARPLATCGFEAGARIVLMRRLGMAAMRMSGAARRSLAAGPAAPTRPLVVLAVDGAPIAD